MSDTIAAICTAQIPSALGVIRLSGDDAFSLADKVIKSNKSIADLKPYCALYGEVFDDEGVFDNVVALKFKSPHSFTGEDTVEFTCHGGPFILNRLLRRLLSLGARLAEGGEFTRRAFLNGKMDLTSAEGVMDLISAQSKQANQMALSANEGVLFKETLEIKQMLLASQASLTAWVDFPEEGVPEVENGRLLEELISAENRLSRVISTADNGRQIKEGVLTAIVGKPNVGKSTLMNLLVKEQRSIVTDIAGTTRDVIEERVTLGNLTLRLCDTAGIRDTNDPIEKIGVEMATERLNKAELILAVFDLSRPLDEDDRAVLSFIKDKTALIILNKSDLEAKFSPNEIEGNKIIISAKTQSADALENEVSRLCGLNNFDASLPVIANERQLCCAIKSKNALSDAISALQSGMPLDAVGVCIDDALNALFEMTGERASDKIIDQVFSTFCVGK